MLQRLCHLPQLPLFLTLCMAPAWAETPPPTAGQAVAATRFQREVAAFVETYGLAEVTRSSFLRTAQRHPRAAEYQEAISCVSAGLTTEFVTVYLTPIAQRHVNLEELQAVNQFLRTPLGAKLLQLAHATAALPGEAAPPRPAFSREEQLQLTQVTKESWFASYASFAKQGFQEYLAPSVQQAMLGQLKRRCAHLPHPW